MGDDSEVGYDEAWAIDYVGHSPRELLHRMTNGHRSEVWQKASAVVGGDHPLISAVCSLQIEGLRARRSKEGRSAILEHRQAQVETWTKCHQEATAADLSTVSEVERQTIVGIIRRSEAALDDLTRPLTDPEELKKYILDDCKQRHAAVRKRTNLLGKLLKDETEWRGRAAIEQMLMEHSQLEQGIKAEEDSVRNGRGNLSEERARCWGECDFKLKSAGWSDEDIARLIEELHLVIPPGQAIADEFFASTKSGDATRLDVERVREVRARYRKIAKSRRWYWANLPTQTS